MKIRTDFVTNSSSASFVLARKGELTEKQKAAIVSFVENRMLGERLLSADASEEEVQKVFKDMLIDDEDSTGEAIRKVLKSGRDVYYGSISFDESDNDIADLYLGIWDAIERAGNDNFEGVETDLCY